MSPAWAMILLSREGGGAKGAVFLHSRCGGQLHAPGRANDLQRHQFFCGNFCLGIFRACARNWSIVWMYPSHLLQPCPFIGVYFVYSIACKCGAIVAGFYIHALHAPSHPCVRNISFLHSTQKHTRANTKEEQPQWHWLLFGKKPRAGGGGGTG